MNATELLQGALDVIREPEQWCIYHLGLTADGLGVRGNDPRAVQWCALGAFEKVTGQFCSYGGEFAHVWDLLNTAARARLALEGAESNEPRFPNYFIYYNNSHEHGDVVLMFKDAIALSEEGAI